MQTSLYHLPLPVQQDLEEACRLICAAASPQKIILLSQQPATTNIDTSGALAPYLERLNFLIILEQATNQQRTELQEKLETTCRRQGLRINALIHTRDQLDRMLKQNPFLFPNLQDEGLLLYDSGTAELAIATPYAPQYQATLAQQHFDRWFTPACAFYQSAQFNLFRKELLLAAFLLHQSLEHSFTAVHLVFTGYRPTTHNLDKMRRYTSRFSATLAGVFPRHTEEENHLFYLLKTAYSRARYAHDYQITSRECHILLGRVRKLLLVARCICRERILALQCSDQI